MKHGHNHRNSKTYRAWTGMRCRCTNKNHVQYKDYGGRGITVSPEWNTFTQFFLDMGKAPPGLSLDRIDNEKGYCKENCRWATQKEQSSNRRQSWKKKLSPEEVQMVLDSPRGPTSLAAIFGVHRYTIYRIRSGK